MRYYWYYRKLLFTLLEILYLDRANILPHLLRLRGAQLSSGQWHIHKENKGGSFTIEKHIHDVLLKNIKIVTWSSK